MEKIAVVTDTGSNMSFQEAAQKGIHLLPLQITFGEKSYQDIEEISTQEIYHKLKNKEMPKTSMPVYSRIEECFLHLKENGYDTILGVPLTTGLSTTASTMESIARELGLRFVLIDCYSTCQIQKYVCLKAKELVDAQKSADEIVQILEPKIQNANSVILVKDLDHLKRGGRLTPVAARMASLLKIFPILQINRSTQGKIDVLSKVRTETKAYQYAMEQVIGQMKNLKTTKVFLIDTEYPAGLEQMEKALIQAGMPRENITREDISSVIAVHTGMGCTCIQFIEEV